MLSDKCFLSAKCIESVCVLTSWRRKVVKPKAAGAYKTKK